MKKRLLFFMTLFWSVWSFGQNVGDPFTSGDIVYNITSTSPATVEVGGQNGFNSFTGSIANIPSMVTYAGTDYSVTSIGIQAFILCGNLTSVIIPDSVISIQQDAFNGSGLTSVIIPDSVTSIGAFAFANTLLISVTIPNSVISIVSDAFASNEDLTSVILGNSLTSINSWVFSNCPNLTSVTIPNSVTSIGNYAFLNTGLTSLTIPNSVTSIGGSAFSGTGLTTVTIPDSVISIGNFAFYDCTSLTSVTIPNSVTSIEEYTFGNCLSLNSVTVNWASPLPINANVFQNTPISNATLIVPAGTKALYQAASVWQNFGSIFEPATHLNFDGVNDRVELPNESLYDFTNAMTVEVWMNSNVMPEQWDPLITKGDNSWRLHLNSTGTVDFTCTGTSGGGAVSTTSITDGNWHHVAGVYNGTSLKIYIDGVLENQVAATGSISNSIFPVYIGNNSDYTVRFYTGNIDEVRIWNIGRSAEQINGSKNCELQGNETGLVANYKFNQGLDAADNTSITTLTDATANANNGTLVNFTKTGTTSNFLAGSPVTTGSIIPSVATVTTPVTYTQGATATALTATVGANGSSLVWYTTSTGGTGTTAPTPSTATVGSTSYWVSSTNANGCESARTEIVVTVNASTPATHLNFDGVNDRVELSNESNFDFTSTFSIEAWIRVNSFTQEWQTLISKGAEGPRIHRFGVSDFIAFGTGPADDLVSTVSVNDGNWHHIAATCNNGFKSLYVDGVLQGTQIVGTPLVTNNDNVRIGSQIDSYSPIRAFHGDIDEVRIWNVARTAEQINGSKNCELQGNETGLVAKYKFNQGIDAAVNTAITSLIDATANGNNGTLVNFTKTGTTSNFLAGSPVTTGSIIPSVATVTTPVTYTQGATATALTATVGANGSSLVWYTTATGGTGTTAPTPSTATVGSTSYWVSSTNANGCESARTEIVVTVNSVPATHLNFDGVNDYVNLSNLISGGSSYTKQAMIRPTYIASGAGQNIISNSNEVFWIFDGNIRAGNNGNFQHVLADASSLLNTWNMVTVTYDAPTTTMKLYINEILVSENNSVSATVGGNIQIGAFASIAFFNGDIDEVRIWNRALPLAEIQNNMNCELPSPSTQNSLVAYYKFNQGTDAADNTTITTLTDASGNANNGTLVNFTKTGTTSNFLAGSPIVTGTNCAVLSNESFEVANNIKIYPNPSNGIFAIETQEDSTVEVFDMIGKKVYSNKVSVGSSNIDLSNYTNGIYLLTVTNQKGNLNTYKLIKE